MDRFSYFVALLCHESGGLSGVYPHGWDVFNLGQLNHLPAPLVPSLHPERANGYEVGCPGRLRNCTFTKRRPEFLLPRIIRDQLQAAGKPSTNAKRINECRTDIRLFVALFVDGCHTSGLRDDMISRQTSRRVDSTIRLLRKNLRDDMISVSTAAGRA